MPFSRKRNSKEDKIEIGRAYEELAAQFFLDKHYTILHRNYRAGHREIDLIVKKDNVIAFVEVKAAKSKSMGHPAERVNKKKITNLTKAAQQYLIENKITDADLRFDVITFLDGTIEYFPAAFGADENDM